MYLTCIQAVIAEAFMLGLSELNTEWKRLILLKQQQQIRKQYKPKTDLDSVMHRF